MCDIDFPIFTKNGSRTALYVCNKAKYIFMFRRKPGAAESRWIISINAAVCYTEGCELRLWDL